MSIPQPHRKTLLIIGFIWPEPNATAAGGRMMQLIDFFLGNGYKITFASTAAEMEHACDLEKLGIKKVQIKLNHSSFDDFLVELEPDVVLFDRFMVEEQFGWRVAQFAPNALRILETQDLHSLRTVRQETLKKGMVFTTGFWMEHETTKREIASIYRSDITLLLSTYENDLLKNKLRIDENLVLYLPFLLDPIENGGIAKWPSFEERSDFICIGNGKHAPNVDAVMQLKKEIWPFIHKALPKANLHIYGAYLPQKIAQLHNPTEGFYVHGWVADVREVLGTARLNLAPLRFGAGIKGKLIEAMYTGTPNVTTEIGAEGMHNGLPWNGEIADDPQAFAQAAVKLYTDKKTWQMAQNKGVQIINNLYDKNKLGTVFLLKLEVVSNNLKTHRTNNFIGGMLQHHTIASTKFMAKWIEAKSSKPL